MKTSRTASMDMVCEISKREQEVLRFIANGETSKEIASHLYISHHTVTSHRKNLLEKLGARNVAHLVSLAYSYDFITC